MDLKIKKINFSRFLRASYTFCSKYSRTIMNLLLAAVCIYMLLQVKPQCLWKSALRITLGYNLSHWILKYHSLFFPKKAANLWFSIKIQSSQPFIFHAGDGTWTHTALRLQAPEACASAIPPLLRTNSILPNFK